MKISKLLAVVLIASTSSMSQAGTAPRSPENQVFQFAFTGNCTAWSDGSKNTATSYLWIPENCTKLKGLLILCTNVPEHGLVGHPAIRKVCEENNLGIVWSTPTFMNFGKQQPGQKKMCDEYSTSVAFLQELLDGLAKISGYEEVATVPWLPMGESGHLLMVDALVEQMPQRCIAGIWIKNNHLPPKNREVPALVAFGTAQEWSQDKGDIRAKWNDIGKAYEGILGQRKDNPNWPLSFVIDGTSGHFDCSERLTDYFARYIDLVSKARIADDGSLRPVKIGDGFVADLPVPGHEGKPVSKSTGTDALPWYFDEAAAKEAQAIAAINWKAETQFPAFLDENGTPLAHTFNGITNIKSVVMESDGITFTIRGTMLDQIPEGFVGAGEKLAKTPGEPEVEWLCGPVVPLGNGRFRIALDRGSKTTYVALRKAGSDSIRAVVQPAGIDLNSLRNSEGAPQVISFDKLPDVPAGTKSLPLSAKSDSGLPVGFTVISGPATIEGNNLVFTPIPPRTKYPLEVTVGAWQWGRATDPKVRTSDMVKQTFRILQP